MQNLIVYGTDLLLCIFQYRSQQTIASPSNVYFEMGPSNSFPLYLYGALKVFIYNFIQEF